MDDEIDVQPTLLQAAGEGDAKTVSLLLSQKPELYERDEEDRTPLHLALEAGSPKVAKLLFEAGFDPQASTRRKFNRSERAIGAFLIAAIAFLAKLVFSIVDIRLRRILRIELLGELISWTLWTFMLYRFGMTFWNIYFLDHVVLQGPSLVSAATSFKGATESMITLLLDAGFEPDEVEQERLWIHAAERGYRAVCERLLSKGIEVDQPFADPESGWYITALHCACRASRPILVSLLLEHGADPRLKDSLGRSALLFACESSPGRDDNTQTDTKAIVEMLLQAEAVETINDRAQRTEFAQSEYFPQSGLGWPLAEACCNGQPEVVLLLLIAGANPNIKDDSGITALHAAARAEIGQDSPMCDALLEHKAEVNAMTADGWSPLGYAIFYGSSGGSGETLIRAGADIGSGAGRFGTVLQLTARHEVASGDLLKLMLSKDDSSVNVIGGIYSTPLFAALNRPEGYTPQLGHPLDYVKLLFQHRADLNLTNTPHRSPLIVAAQHQSVEVVRFLIENGAEVCKENKEDDFRATGSAKEDQFTRPVIRTSILSWVYPWEAEKYELLLEHGAPAQSDSILRLGWTNLELACSSSKTEYIRSASLLLKFGASSDDPGPEGGYPLHRAAFERCDEQIRALLSHGALATVYSPVLGTALNSLCKGLKHVIISEDIIESFSANLKLLLSSSLAEDLCRPDRLGATPLHTLVGVSKQTDLVMDTYATPNTLLPCDSKTETVVVMLLELLGSSDSNIMSGLLSARDSNGLLPIHIAARNGDLHVLRLLLSFHISLFDDHANYQSETQAENQSEFAASHFQTNPNELRDKAGLTILHHAAANGRALACIFLLSQYEDVPETLPEADLHTAAALATANDHPRVAKYILECIPNHRPDRSEGDVREGEDLQQVCGQGTPSPTTTRELMDSVPVMYAVSEEMILGAIKQWDTDHPDRDAVAHRM